MPILLVFALVAACLPLPWWEPPLSPARGAAAALTGGSVALVLAAAFALRTWVVRTLRRDPDRRVEVVQTYGRVRRVLFFVNLSVAAACVVLFGWGWLVTQSELLVPWSGKVQLAPFGELAVPLPYFAILLGCWLIYYDAERALHRALNVGGRPFLPRFAYLFQNLRQFALMVLLPVALFVTQQTLTRFDEGMTKTDLYRVASLAAMPVAVLLLPLLLKPFLGLEPMPAGPVRDRLEATARRLDFRCTEFLLWPTHGAVVNAMITGLLPRVRYVVFTDRILEDLPPDELDAVLGHEIGHAKHAHLWLYAAFLMLSLTVIAAAVLLVRQRVGPLLPDDWVQIREQLNDPDSWLQLPPVALAAGYLFVVLGALSRRCERQADVYACKAMSCGDPACTGHDATTVYPPGGTCLCPTGIRTFVRALERVGELGGADVAAAAGPRTVGRVLRDAWAWVRHWLHGPMPRRVAFLRSLIDRPAVEPRFQRRVFVFKCALMLALTAALVALGEAVGWRALFNEV